MEYPDVIPMLAHENGVAARINLIVADPDAVAERAVAAGARVLFPVADQPYGFRQGRVVDPFGHHRLIGRPPACGWR